MMRNPTGEPFPFLPMAVSHFTGDCPLVGAQSLHQLDISSYGHFIKWNGQFVNWTIHQKVIWKVISSFVIVNYEWYFCLLLYYQLNISSSGHFIHWTFHQLDISSTGHFIKWTFYQMDISSNGHYVNWTIQPKKSFEKSFHHL